MEIVKGILLVLHFLGFAAIMAGFLGQTRAAEKKVESGVLHGAWTQLVTGVALVGVASAGDVDVNHVKIGVKTLVLVTILALALWGRRKPTVPTGVWGAIGGLTVLNVVIAVLW